MNLALSTRAREKLHNVADYAKDALDTGAHITGEKARAYAALGLAQLQRARGQLPVQLQRPSTPMVLGALGVGLVIGLLLGGKATHAIEDIADANKGAARRRRLNNLSH